MLNLLLQRVKTKAGEEQLKTLIEQHVAATGSAKAKRILDNWSQDAWSYLCMRPQATSVCGLKLVYAALKLVYAA